MVDRSTRAVPALDRAELASLLAEHAPGRYRIRPPIEAVVVFVAVVAATFVTVSFIHLRALDAQKQEIRQGVLRTANVLSTQVDVEQHRGFNTPGIEGTAGFIAAEQKLIRAKQADARIAFLYTAVLDSNLPPLGGEEDSRVALLAAYDHPPAEMVEALVSA